MAMFEHISRGSPQDQVSIREIATRHRMDTTPPGPPSDGPTSGRTNTRPQAALRAIAAEPRPQGLLLGAREVLFVELSPVPAKAWSEQDRRERGTDCRGETRDGDWAELT